MRQGNKGGEDSQGGVQTSTYDAANNLTKREFNGSGLTPLRIDFTYNGNNQVDTITRYSDLSGTTVVATTDYDYDGVGRITNLHHKDGSATNISNYTYVYDAVGNLSTEELDGTTTTYQYDDANQLTDDGTNTHEYDANGNRIDGGYDVGPINQYTTDGTWDYTYDAEGNMTEKEDTVADIKWEYGYDHMNRLVWVEKIDTNTTDVLMRADYKYDALGNRIEKAVDADGDGAGGTDTTRYSYDGFKTNGLSYIGNENWDIWADLDGDNSNALEMRYIRGDGIDQLFARHDDVGTVAWYLTDRLGSVRDMTDNSGTVQNTIVYDGFGNVTSESNVSFGDRYKWTGRELDVETNLQYNRERYYDSQLNRWISKDPLGFDAGDSNLYRYVSNRPTVESDPSGLQVIAKPTVSGQSFAGSGFLPPNKSPGPGVSLPTVCDMFAGSGFGRPGKYPEPNGSMHGPGKKNKLPDFKKKRDGLFRASYTIVEPHEMGFGSVIRWGFGACKGLLTRLGIIAPAAGAAMQNPRVQSMLREYNRYVDLYNATTNRINLELYRNYLNGLAERLIELGASLPNRHPIPPP